MTRILVSILIIALFVAALLPKNESFVSDVSTDMSEGLGDRLLDMVGLYAFSKVTNTTFNITWHQDNPSRSYGIQLLDFSNFDMFRFNNIKLNNHFNKTTGFGTSPYFMMKFLRKNNVTIDPHILVKYYLECAKLIDFHPLIKKSLPDRMKESVAIHLRRTDKINNSGDMVHETSTNEYERINDRLQQYIDKLVSDKHDTCFYVISDDDDYKNTFISNLTKRHPTISVITTSKTDLPDDVKHIDGAFSVFEFYCLSQCRMILQCIKMSTFSTCAALISQVPLVSFMDYTREWSLLAWKPCIYLELNGVMYAHDYKESEGEYLISRYQNISIT